MKAEAHRGIREFLPLRRDEVPDPSAGPGQGHSADEENHEHDVGERGREVHHLQEPSGRASGNSSGVCPCAEAPTEVGCDRPPGHKLPTWGHPGGSPQTLPGLGTQGRPWDPRAGRTGNKVRGAIAKAVGESAAVRRLLRRQLPEELPREESYVPPSSPAPTPPSA